MGGIVTWNESDTCNKSTKVIIEWGSAVDEKDEVDIGVLTYNITTAEDCTQLNVTITFADDSDNLIGTADNVVFTTDPDG